MSIRIFLTIFCALLSLPAPAAEPLSIAVARWARNQGHVKADRSPSYLELNYADPLRKALPGAVSITN
ncbi:MAG TPA: hypothetical protein PLU16_12485 [Gallionellaceae bacterium]|nr:hypothetical protein [Gallionellaceae bacterium]HQS76025.1 hypothetical protein [Gallionellaceae bacterium]